MIPLADIGLIVANAEGFLRKLTSILSWKGNFAPHPEHFKPGSIHLTAGVNAAEKRVWIQFAFEDATGAHTVKADMLFNEVGKRGGADVITFDGVTMENADLVIGHREGWDEHGFYARAVVEFKYTVGGEKFDVRFDGPA